MTIKIIKTGGVFAVTSLLSYSQPTGLYIRSATSQSHCQKPTFLQQMAGTQQPQKADISVVFSLLLACGDIETNPGPVYQYPCTVCAKPVRRNQRGIACDRCDKWTHARCGDVGEAEYSLLATHESHQWLCPVCIRLELPFTNSSLAETNTSGVRLEDGCDEEVSPILDCKSSAIICHLNAQSLLPKIDEVRATLRDAKRPVILGVSEKWLN